MTTQTIQEELEVSFSPANRAKLEALRPERRAVIEDLFVGDGTKDAARIAARFGIESTFQIGGMPPVTTREGVRAMLAGFFASGPFVSLEHELLEVYDLDEALIWRANAVYRLPDGGTITTPYVNRVTFVAGECADYRVHIDLSSLRPS